MKQLDQQRAVAEKSEMFSRAVRGKRTRRLSKAVEQTCLTPVRYYDAGHGPCEMQMRRSRVMACSGILPRAEGEWDQPQSAIVGSGLASTIIPVSLIWDYCLGMRRRRDRV